MTVVAYLNGVFTEPGDALIPIDERGHQFGDGVYEVVRVYSGRPFLLSWHLDRLEQSLAAIGIDNPHTRDEWMNLIFEAIRRSNEADSLVYWQVTRGIAIRSHAFPNVVPSVSMTVRPLQNRSDSSAGTLLCLPDERWANVYVKTINLLPNVMAKEIARRQGATEALFVRAGTVTEGSSSNAWVVRDQVIYTAPANRWILNGITRRFVLQLAREMGYAVKEERYSIDHLAAADEVFMTGSTVEVQPIAKVLVSPADEQSLRALSDDQPQPLLQREAAVTRQASSAKVLWESKQHGTVTMALKTKFGETVERFRNDELPNLISE